MIDVNLNPVHHQIAWNSDTLLPQTIDADSFAFIPAESEYRIIAQDFLHGLLVEFKKPCGAEHSKLEASRRNRRSDF